MYTSILKSIPLCFLSALLLTLPFNNGNLWLFAWFGFVPLFFALEGKSKGRAFLLSYLTGIIFWSAAIYWLIHVTLPGLILLVLYLALYFGVFGFLISSFFLRPSSLVRLFAIASLWVLLEYIRSYSFSGFGWALLGYSQYLNLPVIQIADLTGVWGVSFLVMMVNVAIYAGAGCRVQGAGRNKRQIFIGALILLISLSYGFLKLYHAPGTKHHTPLKISVIQGNIPQELKWDPLPQAKYYILKQYLSLSGQSLKDGPDLIIWPEASLPVVAEEEPSFLEAVEDFARQHKVNILLGAVTARQDSYYNSALLISGREGLPQQYDKVHLVPFGEYIPLRKYLPFLQAVVPIGEISPGAEYRLLSLRDKAQVRFGVLICFEDLFPEISRRFVENGAGFLVNITNDAWYKKTSATYQHLQASVLRAVENRLFLVRAANTGVSAFIAPSGRIVSLLSDKAGREIFIAGYRTQAVFASEGPPTLYTRYGDIFILFCIIAIFYFQCRHCEGLRAKRSRTEAIPKVAKRAKRAEAI